MGWKKVEMRKKIRQAIRAGRSADVVLAKGCKNPRRIALCQK
jgi:hypothetical protein